MDLNQLHYFIVVARTQNITRAAQELYVTQSALSRAIARLEGELQMQLFDRKSNGLELNENGRIFLEHAQRGLDAINGGVRLIRERTENRKIYVSNYAFLDSFASFCDSCLAELRGVDLVAFDGSRSASDYPTDSSPDVVLIPERAFRNYTVVKAYLERWCVMYHRDYVFRSECDGKRITLDQLMRESIVFDNSPFDRELLDKLFPEIPANLRFATHSDSSRVAVNRCQAIGIIPVSAFYSLKSRVNSIPIEAMLIEGCPIERLIYLSHKPGFLTNADDCALLELLDRHVSAELQAVSEFYGSYFKDIC